MTRKVVYVNYVLNDVFKIPDELDLENKEQVLEWWVKWNQLHIVKADGTTLEIKSEGWTEAYDYKRPKETEIMDAAELNLEEDDEPEKCDECGFRLAVFKPNPLIWKNNHLCEPCYAQYDAERLGLQSQNSEGEESQ